MLRQKQIPLSKLGSWNGPYIGYVFSKNLQPDYLEEFRNTIKKAIN